VDYLMITVPGTMENRRTMKILMLIERFQPIYTGAGKQALGLAHALVERGLKVQFLVSLLDSDSPKYELIEGIPVHRLPFSVDGRPAKAMAFGQVAKWMWHQRRSFDILHVHGPYATLLAFVLIARILGKKIVLKTTSFGADTIDGIENADGVLSRVWGRIYRSCDAIVNMTSAQYERNLSSGVEAKKLWLIPNGLVNAHSFMQDEPTTKKALRKKLGLNINRKYALFVGSLHQGKGVDILVNVWQLLRSDGIEVDLLLVGPFGNVDYVRHLKRRISENDLVERIHFIGETKNVAEWLKACDLFVFPTRIEGFGNAIVEAMAAGLPVVVSKISGVTTDIVIDGTGILVEGENAREFRDAIKKIICDSKFAKSLGAAAQKSVRERYPMDLVAEKYIRLYHALNQ
jgi:glycosyltransferase involved in cell wall biosynthesis